MPTKEPTPPPFFPSKVSMKGFRSKTDIKATGMGGLTGILRFGGTIPKNERTLVWKVSPLEEGMEEGEFQYLQSSENGHITR